MLSLFIAMPRIENVCMTGPVFAETILDLQGLKCPLPALRTRKALAALGAGQILVVNCTDPLAAIDIPHLVENEGHALESSAEDQGVLTFRIRKAEPG